MRDIDTIIVHSSDSSFGNALVIDEWHKLNGWDMIGYHYVICNGCDEKGEYLGYKDGAIESGRGLEKVGAHAKGFNSKSIGICLVSDGTYTTMQMLRLKILISELMLKFGISKDKVIGHRELEGVTKSCPENLDMDKLRGEL